MRKVYLYIKVLIIWSVLLGSCTKSQTTEIPAPYINFKNVVILGNSLTLSVPSKEIGWNNNWGMAASVADSDYVHRLTVKFKKYNPACKVTTRFSIDFEVNYPTYDFDKYKYFKDLKDSKPDLLILRLGEHVYKEDLDEALFRSRYEALVKYFAEGNVRLHVLSVGPLWPIPAVERAMRSVTPYVSLARMTKDPSNFALDHPNPAVAQHPGDKGMRVISDLIWLGIVRLKPKYQ